MKITHTLFLVFFVQASLFAFQKQALKFKDFQVTVYKGPLKSPDFSSHEKARNFKTRIEEACKEGINFAGHYTLAIWGCGTACQSSMLVDRKTGKIYEGLVSSLGQDFKKDSKLLIKNEDGRNYSEEELKDCSYCRPEYFIWISNTFKKRKIK